jgi:hypothetical protein
VRTLTEIVQANRYDLGHEELVIRDAVGDLADWMRRNLDFLAAVVPGAPLSISAELSAAIEALQRAEQQGAAALLAA